MRSTADRYSAMRKPKAPEQSRESILRAAILEFARSGYNGAKVEEIAAATNVNKRMVYYYFGGKDGLYISVLEHVYAEIREAEGNLSLDELEPLDAIRAIVEFTFNYYVEHPHFVRLIAIENIQEGRFLQQSSVIKLVNTPIIEKLGSILTRGKEKGLVAPEIDPVELHKAISALSFFHVANRGTFSHIFAHDMTSLSANRNACTEIVKMISAYIRKKD